MSLQYKVMDAWRWRSLTRWWGQRARLRAEEQQALQKALMRMGHILAGGYTKYGKFKAAQEIQAALNCITAGKDVVTPLEISYDGDILR